jgi:hypothetical protein
MSNIPKKLEMVANFAIICVAILIAATLYQRYRAEKTGPPQIAIGASVPLSGVDWKSHSKTLVFGLSTQCHFCTESAPFYRQLVAKFGDKNDVHLLAVLPQSSVESRDHLVRLGVRIEDVRQESLNSIPINSTPTLLIVDQRGIVVNEWVGKLTPAQESAVLAAVGL